MILCAHSTSRSSELSKKRRSCSENMWEVCMIIKLGRHFLRSSRCACGLVFLLSKGWLAGQENSEHMDGLGSEHVDGLGSEHVDGLGSEPQMLQETICQTPETEKVHWSWGNKLQTWIIVLQVSLKLDKVCGLWCSQHFYKAIITQQSALGNTSLLKWR